MDVALYAVCEGRPEACFVMATLPSIRWMVGEQTMRFDGQIMGAALLVGGTAIGAGMLALPVTTAVAGFNFAMLLLTVCFAYMLMTLFMLLEAILYIPQRGANIIAMAKQLLGPVGESIAWFAFLMLMYAAAVAYISGGGALLAEWSVLQHLGLAPATLFKLSVFLFTVGFGLVAYFGTRSIDWINRLLMIGLIGSYFFVIFLVLPHLRWTDLSSTHAGYLLAAVPVVILAFTSHIVLPSLLEYLDQNVARLKKALIIGSLLPFVFYAIWEMVFIGFIPEHGAHSLFSIAGSANPLIEIKKALAAQQVPFVVSSNEVFSFCALITSFLGVVLSLGDFLADGFHIPKTTRGRLLIASLVFVPPLFFLMILHVDVFVSAIRYAGGIFVSILYCLFPPLMLWRARYVKKLTPPAYVFPGGKIVLCTVFLLGFGVIGLQLGSTLSLLPQVHGVPPLAS